MSRSTANFLTLTIFVLAGLARPAMYYWNWPPNLSPDILILIWPTQPLAAMEASAGPTVAAIVATGANVVLHTLVGILAILAATWRLGLRALSLAVALAITAMSYRWAGYDTAHMNWHALVFALFYYGGAFELARGCLRKSGRDAVADEEPPTG